jgi:hypothetical protein
MTFIVIFAFLLAVAGYWTVTQILPERRQKSLVRQGLADGYLHYVNQSRRQKDLPLLEMDEDLVAVAERKAAHQLTTGRSEEGWDYPRAYADMFGRSLLMEMLLDGPTATMAQRLLRQRDLFDGEWVRCGIGVASGQTGKVVVALVLCRDAWEPVWEQDAEGAQSSQLVPAGE